ncbi:MAG: lysophospholipid acyltransferase family protein [Pseudomonadota bacterium]
MTAPNSRKQAKPSRKRFRKWLRAISQGPWALAFLSRLAIWYLTLVYRTNRFVVEPADIVESVSPKQPLIVGVWHGQHILLPVLPIGLNGSAMISRNFDGEVTARIVEHFGNRTIRASGGRKQKDTLRKGGMTGFLEMLRALEAGDNVVQTADIPKGISRRAGLGIVTLAQRSGAPVLPLAIASSRRFVFKRAWDKAALNLPFGTTAICAGELIHIKSEASDDELEVSRKQLETEMNRATKRAYELTGNPE